MTIKNYGETPMQRILWMSMFARGIDDRRGLPYVLVGKPGTAKTSIVRRLYSMAGIPFEGVLGSLRSPTDFLGVPVPQRRQLTAHDQHLSPDGDSEFLYMHYAPSGFGVRAAAAKRYGLLLDEVNTCPPSVQAALLRVLFEGVVGELELPPGVRMLLAMNATQDAAGGWDIAMPLANRMGWLDWPAPTVKDFNQYLVGGCKMRVDQVVDPKEEEARFDAEWPGEFAKACGETAGYLQRRPAQILQPPANGAACPFTSPRTWEFFVRARAASAIYGLTEDESTTATSAFIGTAAQSDFLVWRKDANLPNPEDLLTGAAQFHHNPARLDRTAAVLSAVAALVIEDTKHPQATQRVGKAWEFVQGLVSSKDPKADASDIALPTVAALCQAKLMTGHQVAYKVMAKMEPVMKAAGITQ